VINRRPASHLFEVETALPSQFEENSQFRAAVSSHFHSSSCILGKMQSFSQVDLPYRSSFSTLVYTSGQERVAKRGNQAVVGNEGQGVHRQEENVTGSKEMENNSEWRIAEEGCDLDSHEDALDVMRENHR
jgi:hypothetical protein